MKVGLIAAIIIFLLLNIIAFFVKNKYTFYNIVENKPVISWTKVLIWEIVFLAISIGVYYIFRKRDVINVFEPVIVSEE